jgi:3-hydroxymyristoyl/3-hydroxydecanoyl-(acyl carrier protein) dehydratase
MNNFYKNVTQSGIQPGENSQFVIGADVIAYLTPVKHPMIMVDRIISYHSKPLSLIAERYVSANEPAFVGHFPNMKLWPGIYTLEGLRQACYLLHVLHELEAADLMKGVIELHNRQILRPQINHKLCQSVIDYLKNRKMSDPDLFSVSLKLLEPVFAGSLIKYQVFTDDNDLHCWTVSAVVDERLIAKGIINQSFNV